MILLAVLTAAVFSVENAEFIDTVEEQRSEGYTWEYVGKSAPSGTPALTIKSESNEYILFRLSK